MGVNLITLLDVNSPKTSEPSHTRRAARGPDDDEAGPTRDGRKMPPHEERLRVLHELGVHIGVEALTLAQSQRLSALLYEYRDIMAVNYIDVPEARVPRQKRFRYDPVKEQKLENLCDELLEAGIIKESKSLWNSPVFLLTKPDGSSRFLVDFKAVNAKTKPEFCALPSLEDVLDQISEEKPNILASST